MPLPEIEPNETKDEFIEKCMDNNIMKGEFDNEQRIAVCERLWEEENE